MRVLHNIGCVREHGTFPAVVWPGACLTRPGRLQVSPAPKPRVTCCGKLMYNTQVYFDRTLHSHDRGGKLLFAR